MEVSTMAGEKGTIFRTYTLEEKASATELTLKLGPTAASAKLGIPRGTLSCWTCHARSAQRASDSPHEEAPSTTATSCEVAPSIQEASERTSSPPSSRKVARVYTPSQRAQALEVANREGVSAASRKLRITRFSIHNWRRKVKLAAEGKISVSPVNGPDTDAATERDQRILKVWKAHPGLGPSQVRNQLRREGFKVSVHTVRCVLEANGYVTPKVRRTDTHDQRYEAVRPNQMWHLDFLHRYIHKQPIYVLLIVDDFSRFIVGGTIWDAERSQAVIETFETAVARYGKPEMVMSDGGSAFWAWRGVSRFTRLLEELSCDQLIATIPQVNGKLEVLNANIQKELFNQEKFFDLGQTYQRLNSWISFYNFRRTHHALGGILVPADRYFGRAEEVLAQIEAGRAPDGIGESLPVGERLLDLFRVTSCAGKMEIHLMGERIWPHPAAR